ncbi:hypothetical protein N7486_003928 [Penicillium sp. IBT 16267x]|nr:hypothetical protein N7486_003928 [Penicillium sp. IBT 16267x]
MDRYNNHRPPSSMRSSLNSVNFNHVVATVTPPASPPAYPSYPLSPPSKSVSISETNTGLGSPGMTTTKNSTRRSHSNALIEAAKIRIQDEQEMQDMLHSVQLSCQVWNPEIEPEHETNELCDCAVHKYLKRKIDRLQTQEMWSKAVIYPGEKPYDDCTHLRLFKNNPYSTVIISPYGLAGATLSGTVRPDPQNHATFLQQTIALNTSLNAKAKIAVQALEPSFNIWDLEHLESLVSNMANGHNQSDKQSKRATLKKALSVKSSDERAAGNFKRKFSGGLERRQEILTEEEGRWQVDYDRHIVAVYQQTVGISLKVYELRTHQPLQYLHLLRAGYFEPIPISWSEETQTSNPLRFSIDAAVGWPGVTPAWRGYDNTAEERLYWILSNRDAGGVVIKPDIISALDMARTRLDSAVDVPPAYYDPDDTCHAQHTSHGGYSKQVKSNFTWNTPMSSTDETMILLDVSGSMDFNPARPNYNQSLITGFVKTSQPKNKELAKAIIRRFIHALGNHDHHGWQGYPLITFSSQANYLGSVNEWNVNEVWEKVRFGGRTRVMTGWAKIKELHFQKHLSTAKYHPIYGWQAGPETPKLRLLLILDGEASDMDEFELELLGLSWAYTTIFLIGVEGSLSHHRHANKLQRISEVNPRVSFVEAQGNVAERFILHEILKRHLGRDLSMADFRKLQHFTAELPSPEQIRGDRCQSAASQLEQVPVELPSLEETRHWQIQQHLVPLHVPSNPLVELRADRDPIELPAAEPSSSPRQFHLFPTQAALGASSLPLTRPRSLNHE